jgi:hypothetical protein
MAINQTDSEMAIHIIAHAGISVLRARKWTRDEVEEWLLGMDAETQQAVRDKMNKVIAGTKKNAQSSLIC